MMRGTVRRVHAADAGRPKATSIAALTVIAVIAAGVLSGCDTRSHENPFDPENPGTHGEPETLIAIAGDEAVELRLDPLGIEDVTGYRIWRWAGAETTVVGDSLFPASTTAFTDTSVVNGVTYHYALDLFTGGDPQRGAVDLATPGRTRPWVIDAGIPPLVLLSADARRERGRFGEGGPYTDLAVDQTDGSVWACDVNELKLWHFDADGAVLSVRDDLPAIDRLAIGGPGGTVWALSRDERILFQLDGSSTVIDTSLIGGTGALRDLDTDAANGTAWIIDGTGVLRHFGPGAVPPTLSLSGNPFAVSFDPEERGFWVSDPTNALVSFFRRTTSAWPQERAWAGVAIPREVAARVGPAGATQVWVVDLNGSLYLIDLDDGVIARSAPIETPRAPLTAPDGTCFLLEGGTGTLIHVNDAAEIDSRLARLVAPRKVAFWWRS